MAAVINNSRLQIAQQQDDRNDIVLGFGVLFLTGFLLVLHGFGMLYKNLIGFHASAWRLLDLAR